MWAGLISVISVKKIYHRDTEEKIGKKVKKGKGKKVKPYLF
jgi:hypothetical protein